MTIAAGVGHDGVAEMIAAILALIAAIAGGVAYAMAEAGGKFPSQKEIDRAIWAIAAAVIAFAVLAAYIARVDAK